MIGAKFNMKQIIFLLIAILLLSNFVFATCDDINMEIVEVHQNESWA